VAGLVVEDLRHSLANVAIVSSSRYHGWAFAVLLRRSSLVMSSWMRARINLGSYFVTRSGTLHQEVTIQRN